MARRSTPVIGCVVAVCALAVVHLAQEPMTVGAQGPLPDKFLFQWGARAHVGQFNQPVGIAVAPDGVCT